MKKFAFALVIGLFPCTVAMAQKPAADRLAAGKTTAPAAHDTIHVASMGELTPTPEMWFYEQERRRAEDPQAIVQANAQARAGERRARMAALAWYGMSNSRPSVSPDPIQGDFSPHWVSGNYMPMRWTPGTGRTLVILQNGADR